MQSALNVSENNTAHRISALQGTSRLLMIQHLTRRKSILELSLL